MYFFSLNLVKSSISQIFEEKFDETLLGDITKFDLSFDPRPWSEKIWEDLPNDEWEALFVLKEGEKLLGMAVFRLSIEEQLAHLLKFLISPDRRREGLGEKLLSKAFEVLAGKNIEKIYLEVEKGNPAIFLYQKLGLKKIHEIADFYGPGRPGLVMNSSI